MFTVPDMTFIDSQARKLFNCFMQPTKKSKKKRQAWIKPQLINTHPYTGKIYNPYIKGMNPETKKKKKVSMQEQNTQPVSMI